MKGPCNAGNCAVGGPVTGFSVGSETRKTHKVTSSHSSGTGVTMNMHMGLNVKQIKCDAAKLMGIL